MCYDDQAIPPVPPGASGDAVGEDIELTAADGNRFAAYIARPGVPNNAQVLIYPDVRGLHGFYKKLALRFAETGTTALALDYFGRTAGISSRDDGFDFWPHVRQLQLPSFFSDVTASLAYLHSDANRATFTVGFCLGGSLSFLSGTEKDFGLAGVIGFYAGLSRDMGNGKKTVLEEGAHVVYPALGLFGGADQGISVDQVHAFDEQLDKSGVEHEIVVYPDAPHSFFDRRFAEFADASSDAWTRVLDFISAHSAR